MLHGVSLAVVGSGWADSDSLLGYLSARLRTLFLESLCISQIKCNIGLENELYRNLN